MSKITFVNKSLFDILNSYQFELDNLEYELEHILNCNIQNLYYGLEFYNITLFNLVKIF